MGAINKVRSKLPAKIPTNIAELKKKMPTVSQLKQKLPPVPPAVTGAIKKLPSVADIRAKLPEVPAIPVKVTVASEKDEPKKSFAPTKTRKGGRYRNRRTRRR
jgi:hypothetical protein